MVALVILSPATGALSAATAMPAPPTGRVMPSASSKTDRHSTTSGASLKKGMRDIGTKE
jgi:hypothetical protein